MLTRYKGMIVDDFETFFDKAYDEWLLEAFCEKYGYEKQDVEDDHRVRMRLDDYARERYDEYCQGGDQ